LWANKEFISIVHRKEGWLRKTKLYPDNPLVRKEYRNCVNLVRRMSRELKQEYLDKSSSAKWTKGAMEGFALARGQTVEARSAGRSPGHAEYNGNRSTDHLQLAKRTFS